MQCYCCFKELEREQEPSKAICIECLQDKLDYKQEQIDALKKQVKRLTEILLTWLNGQRQGIEGLMKSLEEVG